MSYKRRRRDRSIIFNDYPEFRPNVTPREIFIKGSFGGTYWRPINSAITNKKYENEHKKFEFLKDIPDEKMIRDYETDYDIKINKYGVKVGMTLDEWERQGWITEQDPYGWVQWYCAFYQGRRVPELDKHQIDRWLKIASNEKGRWKKRIVNMIKSKKATYNDFTISPKIRQTLLHWAYELVENDVLEN